MSNGKDTARILVNSGLAVVIILLLISLIVSLYEVFNGKTAAGNLIRNPEIVALAIGLILSVLFVDRWRALESKIDGMSNEQRDRLSEIQKFSQEQIELKVEQTISKSENLSAKISSLAEQHPWLQVITDRDIVVETESLRGILRSSYMLLQEDRLLHLYEFLEYCSRKGTSDDPRERKIRLRGAVDDFFEAASFCEVWLEDYALGAEFLKRYIEQGGGAAYIAFPDFARRLLRMGNIVEAKRYATEIERILYWSQWYGMMSTLLKLKPVSERYKWHAQNVLALVYAATGDVFKANRFSNNAESNSFSIHFKEQQLVFNAERQIYTGKVDEALLSLDSIKREKISSFILRDEIMLRERLGLECTSLRILLNERRRMVFGDDHSHDHDSDAETLQSDKERPEKKKSRQRGEKTARAKPEPPTPNQTVTEQSGAELGRSL